VTVIPDKVQLFQNYPNPFNPVTTLRYALSRSEKVSVTVYNILGQQVANLANEVQEPGYKTIKRNFQEEEPVVGSGL